MANDPVSCARIMGSFAPLQRLQNEIAEQQRLLRRVRSLLPGNVREHCVAAVGSAEGITLYSDSPVWASRLRFLAKGILDALQRQDHPARQLRTKVLIASDRGSGARKRRRMEPLSPETSRMLADVAATLDDPGLRSALGRLARHRRTGSGVR